MAKLDWMKYVSVMMIPADLYRFRSIQLDERIRDFILSSSFFFSKFIFEILEMTNRFQFQRIIHTHTHALKICRDKYEIFLILQ